MLRFDSYSRARGPAYLSRGYQKKQRIQKRPQTTAAYMKAEDKHNI